MIKIPRALTLLALAAGTATGARGQGALDARVARADASRISGSASAKVWVLVLSDFQCPYCKQWHDEVGTAFNKEFVATGKVRLAYVHFPLSIHRNAVPAAEAAMCAGAQDRFWPFHDAVFAAASRWTAEANPDKVFTDLAARARLDVAAFSECLASDVMLPMVQADRERGSQLGVRSTPTFLVGSAMIPGAAPLEALRSAVNKALASAR